jgi:fructokinase
VARRLAHGRSLSEDRKAFGLVAAYLGDLTASLVLTWSPHRILLGGGVMATDGLRGAVALGMHDALGDYLPTRDPGYLAAPALDDAGLEGALMLARAAAAEA